MNQIIALEIPPEVAQEILEHKVLRHIIQPELDPNEDTVYELEQQ